jgi:hypothetical protein
VSIVTYHGNFRVQFSEGGTFVNQNRNADTVGVSGIVPQHESLVLIPEKIHLI